MKGISIFPGLMKTAIVVVLGDVSQSPRTINHFRSLINEGYYTHIVGYGNSLSLDSDRSHFHPIKRMQSSVLIDIPFITFLFVCWKAILLVFHLAFVLFRISHADVVLVQNPPVFPSIFISRIYSWYRGSILIVDWHNFSYTLLNRKLKRIPLLERFTRLLEFSTGKMADVHLCVSKGMRRFLIHSENFKESSVKVFYDKPNSLIKHLGKEESTEFLEKLSQTYELPALDKHEYTIFVTSTSYTEDEDLQMLLDAVKICDEKISQCETHIGRATLIITGQGPLDSYFQEKVNQMDLNYFTIHSEWFTYNEYARLLGSADCGISMHASSSGFDLPMKIVDMFGAHLPVLALDFECVGELVQEGHTGLLFENAEGLSLLLLDVMFDRKHNILLPKLRSYIKNKNHRSWEEEWKETVLKILE